MHCAPRNPTGYSGRRVPEDNTPFERAARHVERRSGVSRDVWMAGMGTHPLNARHYRLMCRLANIDPRHERRKRAA